MENILDTAFILQKQLLLYTYALRRLEYVPIPQTLTDAFQKFLTYNEKWQIYDFVVIKLRKDIWKPVSVNTEYIGICIETIEMLHNLIHATYMKQMNQDLPDGDLTDIRYKFVCERVEWILS